MNKVLWTLLLLESVIEKSVWQEEGSGLTILWHPFILYIGKLRLRYGVGVGHHSLDHESSSIWVFYICIIVLATQSLGLLCLLHSDIPLETNIYTQPHINTSTPSGNVVQWHFGGRRQDFLPSSPSNKQFLCGTLMSAEFICHCWCPHRIQHSYYKHVHPCLAFKWVLKIDLKGQMQKQVILFTCRPATSQACRPVIS